MSNEKMREEFEAWYLREYYPDDKEVGLEWLSTEQCGSYRYAGPKFRWNIWQASRAAVVVELPFLYDGPLQRVTHGIEAVGLKVKS